MVVQYQRIPREQVKDNQNKHVDNRLQLTSKNSNSPATFLQKHFISKSSNLCKVRKEAADTSEAGPVRAEVVSSRRETHNAAHSHMTTGTQSVLLFLHLICESRNISDRKQKAESLSLCSCGSAQLGSGLTLECSTQTDSYLLPCILLSAACHCNIHEEEEERKRNERIRGWVR